MRLILLTEFLRVNQESVEDSYMTSDPSVLVDNEPHGLTSKSIR